MVDAKQVKALHWGDEDFKENVEKATKEGKPVFVDFYADWCGPCQMAAPIVDKLAGVYDGKAYIVKVNVDENNQTAADFGVMSIPTVLVLNGEQVLDKKVGFPGEKGYIDMLEKALSTVKAAK